MILLRIRRYGSPDWTQLSLEGELEDMLGQIAAAQIEALAEHEDLHIQVAYEGEAWVDLADFEWDESC